MKDVLLFLIIRFFGLSFDRLNIFKYCIISSAMHEMGHIAAYRLFTGKYPKIKISPFGFCMENNVTNSRCYTAILAAGPVMNIILVFLSYILLVKKVVLNIYVFMLVNLIIFIINIIPVYYLDGGQILYHESALYQRYYREISLIFVVILSVIVYSFTDKITAIFMFVLYFIINMSNDV